MTTKVFKPSAWYTIKLLVTLALIAVGVLVGAVVIAVAMSFDDDVGLRGALIFFLVILALDLAWWIPAMVLAGPYYRSLSYEIQDDQVVMHVGIWTKAVKHVPYRTVTNLTVKQGILDRLFGLGTLDIQTAGMSGTNSAEQSLVGLDSAQEIYEMVAARLQRFRGGMAPTGANVEGDGSAQADDVTLAHVLDELRAIRRALEGDTDASA